MQDIQEKNLVPLCLFCVSCLFTSAGWHVGMSITQGVSCYIFIPSRTEGTQQSHSPKPASTLHSRKGKLCRTHWSTVTLITPEGKATFWDKNKIRCLEFDWFPEGWQGRNVSGPPHRTRTKSKQPYPHQAAYCTYGLFLCAHSTCVESYSSSQYCKDTLLIYSLVWPQ